MVFSSPIFVYYFLPFALAVYYSLWRAPQRVRNGALALLGYIFYGWANPPFVLLMLVTTFVDWLLSLVVASDSWRFWRIKNLPDEPLQPAETMARSRTQSVALTLSIVSNLAMLGYFKYATFAAINYNNLAVNTGLPPIETIPDIVLPLGISFYTFQSLSYSIDVYRGDARAMRSFTDFACFVSMFPHLVAGPILKFSFLANQLLYRTLTIEKFARGVTFFMLGMGKKVLIANGCAQIADAVFETHSRLAIDAWYGLVAYAFQIYFDFSGYSDMAIGLGLMFGFVFARNFDHPYRAESMTDFWRRWHISLSTWLREYLYIPLGGNRKGKRRTYINLMATMLLGGLWHGASWNFILWGGLHGIFLCIERAIGKRNPIYRLPRFVRIGWTFLLTLLTWLFFRSSDLPGTFDYLRDMTGARPVTVTAPLLGGLLYEPFFLVIMGTAAFLTWRQPDVWEYTQRITPIKATVCLLVFVLSLLMLARQAYNPFIYFRF